MALTDVDSWLHTAGYEYHCFVSYPRMKKPDGSTDAGHPINLCAREDALALHRRLGFSIPQPRVFHDSQIGGGIAWEMELRRALCRSVAMVAICANIYYHPSHNWCGLEWATMDALARHRLRGSSLLGIFPLILKREGALPPPVAACQWQEIFGASLTRSYYTTKAFNQKIDDVVNHIEQVADVIRGRGAQGGCGQIEFPTTSAFDGWRPTDPAFPLTGGRARSE
jgi:hypothetical protein